ncbi:MAG: Fic family protein [Candidatus Methanomethylophilaceae archaeon]|nr:Fic family protein [Candidatus Methanomethylophilaceae archaeon]MBP5735420.1 Fic family protein [Candidatus Methanomethylophilaceae archaeon]
MPIEPYFSIKDDTYCYPDSDVLRNKLGITDYDKLASAEGIITVIKMDELDKNPIRGMLDTEHLKKIHRCIFEDIYDWAGEFRTVEISKGIPFCYCANIQTQLDTVFNQLKKENYLKDINDRAQYVSRIAYYLGEINAVHPFREGNGRAQRKFIQQLVSESGHTLSFEKLDSERMIKAASDSMACDYTEMELLISDLLIF